MRFRESERISTVPGSTAFSTVTSLRCNPGLATSFPWLSGHAALFERYKIHKLVYRYKNLKGTSSDGNVILSFDYDTLDAAPSTAVIATQSTHYADGAPWRIFALTVPTDGRKLFTRTTALADVDLKTYDMGQVHISAEGCADTSDHGYIEVDYDIEFFDKQSQNGGSTPLLASASSSYFLGTTQTVSGLIPFSSNVFNDAEIVNTGGSFLLKPGKYLYSLSVKLMGGSANYASLLLDGSPTTPATSVYVTGYASSTVFGALDITADTALTTSWAGSTSMDGTMTRLQLSRL